jgi:hypothetical protein
MTRSGPLSILVKPVNYLDPPPTWSTRLIDLSIPVLTDCRINLRVANSSDQTNATSWVQVGERNVRVA